jgi:ribosomal protein L11 methyltransferase
MSPQDHLAFYFRVSGERRDWVLAYLEPLPFNGFEETDDYLVAYLSADQESPEVYNQLDDLTSQFGLEWHTERIPYTNWNARWEADFQPVQVGNFAGVRATFHAPIKGVTHELVIQPRMAFGTGHHATTYMMMAAMEDMHWAGRSVLDYGCGTGILAILAARLGSPEVHGVDIENEAYENAIDNARVNGAEGIHIYLGDLQAVPAELTFGTVLANINRNVILDSLPALYDRLEPAGRLLVSGILIDDRPIVLEKAQLSGFNLVREAMREQWLLLDFVR